MVEQTAAEQAWTRYVRFAEEHRVELIPRNAFMQGYSLGFDAGLRAMNFLKEDDSALNEEG